MCGKLPGWKHVGIVKHLTMETWSLSESVKLFSNFILFLDTLILKFFFFDNNIKIIFGVSDISAKKASVVGIWESCFAKLDKAVPAAWQQGTRIPPPKKRSTYRQTCCQFRPSQHIYKPVIKIWSLKNLQYTRMFIATKIATKIQFC